MGNMKRKLNILELRRLRECEQHVSQREEEVSPRKKRAPTGVINHAGRTPKSSRKEDPREHQNLSREEIALMFMEVSEKIDRCFDFDLQKWLNRYESLSRGTTNFPEAAMLVMSAAQIYGRKVDFLEDIILHMDQDQKGREDSKEGEKDKAEKATGRKRAARFQPQSLSDCFSDLEFSYIDRKTVRLESLVAPVEPLGVDRRNKFQQMQELCYELRTMPTKQRRQEILHRLRDEANIPSIMSSHTAARKNQILDLESGETIGTRYDYQIYLNFIDVRTGSLTPEHDLKRFFQRCDVIDYLFERQESEREHCERSGRPAPERMFPLMPREFKMYIPPDYLKNKYRIQMNDTSDFDNELHRARISNYQGDPILDLLKSKFAKQVKEKLPQTGRKSSLGRSTPDVSFSNVLCSSRIGEVSENNTLVEEQDSGAFDDTEFLDENPTEHESSSNQVSSIVVTDKNANIQLSEFDKSANAAVRIEEQLTDFPSDIISVDSVSPEKSTVVTTQTVDKSTLIPSTTVPDDSAPADKSSDLTTHTAEQSSVLSKVIPEEPAPLCTAEKQSSVPLSDVISEEAAPSEFNELLALEDDQQAAIKAAEARELALETHLEVNPKINSLMNSKESSPEPELMAIENQPVTAIDPNLNPQPTSQSRLSYEDEGIGPERDSPGQQSPVGFSRTTTLDRPTTLGPLKPLSFGTGTVILASTPVKTIKLKPALVTLNLLKIPECHLRKHLLFTLPVEYKKLKLDLVRRTSNRGKDLFTLAVYSLSPRAPKNKGWMNRADTPEPEDFHGFEDELTGEADTECLYSLRSLNEEKRPNVSRASTPENEFYGFESFDNDERDDVDVEPLSCVSPVQSVLEPGRISPVPPVEALARISPVPPVKTRARISPVPPVEAPTNIPPVPPAEAIPLGREEERHAAGSETLPIESVEEVPKVVEGKQQPEKPQSVSQQTTPNRTLSRDSGISDDQSDRRGSRSKESTPEPTVVVQETAVASGDPVNVDRPTEEVSELDSAPTSKKYIQSVAEAKEMIEKVNNWHRKLKPILIQSEKRNHFDIHAYGTEIIESFGPVDTGSSAPIINFAQVMQNKNQDFTARYFLSMLMLANTNNVHIIARGKNPNRLTSKEDIELHLLSRMRHHQEMESMGEKIPCDNTPTGKAIRDANKSRGKKRKRLVQDNDEGLADEGDSRLRGIRRLPDDEEPDLDFLDKIQRIYPDINGADTVRKRIAFRRGMRQCAYGLSANETHKEQGGASEEIPSEPSQKQKQLNEEPDELLSVDLLTNEAVIVPITIDPEPCCSKSIFSLGESGYESILGEGDC
ncbi:uncharacterized protein LOC131677325 [Topomyia yanbarensis]|uniref:uncharacterized protein LOC131677325 n=1 Tax=Topomyia yanbarensis TaxID=2498891 RepID=UPI00273A7B87|nr:uncharacterized protein LOC131677325 [Topomyia yanbarensis]